MAVYCRALLMLFLLVDTITAVLKHITISLEKYDANSLSEAMVIVHLNRSASTFTSFLEARSLLHGHDGDLTGGGNNLP